MAKTPATPTDTPIPADAAATPADSGAAPAVRTPENTPVPGGGSFRWDAANADWVENPPYEPPVQAA